MEKELLEKAKKWFLRTFKTSCEEKGYCYIKVWHRPIFFRHRTEVVFGKTQEAVDAFIAIQSKLYRAFRWLVLYLLMVVPLNVVAFVLFGVIGSWTIVFLSIVVSVAFLMFPRFLEHKESMYQGQIISVTLDELPE